MKNKQGRCIKCNGIVKQGGIRLGQYAADMQSCMVCGLCDEQRDWYDATIAAYRDMRPPHAVSGQSR